LILHTKHALRRLEPETVKTKIRVICRMENIGLVREVPVRTDN